jgi:hypothetical protein
LNVFFCSGVALSQSVSGAVYLIITFPFFGGWSFAASAEIGVKVNENIIATKNKKTNFFFNISTSHSHILYTSSLFDMRKKGRNHLFTFIYMYNVIDGNIFKSLKYYGGITA